jgi:hypothetical protein
MTPRRLFGVIIRRLRQPRIVARTVVRRGIVGPYRVLRARAAGVMLRVRRSAWLAASGHGVVHTPESAFLATDAPPSDISVISAMRANLDEVVRVLSEADLEWWLTPNESINRYQVGVRERDRGKVLAALRQGAGVDVHAWFRHHGRRRAVLARRIPSTKAESIRVFRVRRLSPTVYYGLLHGCDIHFWVDDESGAGVRALAANSFGSHLCGDELTPTEVEVRGGRYRTVAAFACRHVEDVVFPVDLVYTWVDGADRAWQARRANVLRAHDLPVAADAHDAARYLDREELRYSLRSVAMFADFVRHIYLVTDQQVPEWLRTDHPQITVVDHREIFGPDPALPTFNSHAIESRLHHIEGLSEHYLYMNDDVMFSRRVTPATFFWPNGQSKFFLSRAQIPLGPPSRLDSAVDVAAKNNRRLIAEHFGVTITQKMKHTPHPQRRSVHFEMEDRFPKETQQVAASQLRGLEDYSIASSLHHWYGYLTHRAMPGSIRYRYLDLSAWQLEYRLDETLRSRTFDTFCLNDTSAAEVDAVRQLKLVTRFLAMYYPAPSPYEVD